MPQRHKPLKILANLARYDYGLPERGSSFEYETFVHFFKQQGHQVEVFDHLGVFNQVGKNGMTQQLVEQVKKNTYDLIFTVPLLDIFTPSSLNHLKHQQSGAISVAWMCDDKWRWESFGQHLASSFDHVITTDPEAIAKYQASGYQDTILSQWGFNPEQYKKISLPKRYPVLFVGGCSPWRAYVVETLTKRGIPVVCFGAGWPSGRVTTAEVVKLFNQAEVVLNISNSTQFNGAYFSQLQWPQLNGSWKSVVASVAPGLVEFVTSPKRKEDIKARFFEVTGCGAFLLSYPVEYLDKYFKLSQDLVTYRSIDDLEQKLRYFLHHPQERQKIAEYGYQTAHQKHTYQHRFTELFSKLGL